MKVTYLCNAGIMAEYNNKKVLIDAICQYPDPIFKSTPENTLKSLLDNTPPLDNIDIMLFTHAHCDHFDEKNTIAYLKQNPNTRILSTKETISKIESAVSSPNISYFDLSLHQSSSSTIDDIFITAVSMVHSGKEYSNVENFAFTIKIGDRTIMHVGDASPIESNFTYFDFITENIDLLLVPFPYISLSSGRRIIEKYIKPKRIAVIHFPDEKHDDYGWISATYKSFRKKKNDFFATDFFRNVNECLII